MHASLIACGEARARDAVDGYVNVRPRAVCVNGVRLPICDVDTIIVETNIHRIVVARDLRHLEIDLPCATALVKCAITQANAETPISRMIVIAGVLHEMAIVCIAADGGVKGNRENIVPRGRGGTGGVYGSCNAVGYAERSRGAEAGRGLAQRPPSKTTATAR